MDKFDLIFRGEILPGHDLAKVKARFGHAMQIDDPKRVEAFFSGRPITIRRSLEKEAAAQYYAKMRRIGAVPHLEKVVPESVKVEARPESIAPATPVTPEKPELTPEPPNKAAPKRQPKPKVAAVAREARQPAKAGVLASESAAPEQSQSWPPCGETSVT